MSFLIGKHVHTIIPIKKYSLIVVMLSRNCLDCSFEPQCPYSSKKIYIEPHIKFGWKGWPVDVVQPKGVVGNANMILAIIILFFNSIYKLECNIFWFFC